MKYSPYDLIADEYYDDFHKTGRNFDEASLVVLQNIKDMLPNDGPVLDVGSGKGRCNEYLDIQSDRIVQLDNSKRMLELEPREECVLRIHNSAEDLPFLNSEFTVATAFLCDAFLGLNFLSETFRVLKDGGFFIATNPSFIWASTLRKKIGIELQSTRFKTKKGTILKAPSVVVSKEQFLEMLVVSGFNKDCIEITEHCLPRSSQTISQDIQIPADELNINVY
ncbi:unnamed protein product, partial [marine sediment metagenome]